MEEVKNDGIQQGRQEGIQKRNIEMALSMLAKSKYELEEISEITGLTLEEVKELAEKKTV